jgi:hypothetical protein
MSWEARADAPGEQPYLHFWKVEVEEGTFPLDTPGKVAAMFMWLECAIEEYPAFIPIVEIEDLR